MKTTLRLGLFAAAAIFAVAALPLLAGPHGAGDRGGGHGLGRLLPPPSYLDLTSEQETAVATLRDEAKAKIRPLLESQRQVRQQLRDLLDANKPDAAAIGNLTIQLHQNRGAVKEVLLATEHNFIALLNPEQKAKYENFRELRRDRMSRKAERFGFGGAGADAGGDEP